MPHYMVSLWTRPRSALGTVSLREIAATLTHSRLIIIAAAAVTLSVLSPTAHAAGKPKASQDASTREESLARFRKDMADLKVLSEALEKTVVPSSPSSGILVVRTTVGRLRSISTKGLPDDLKSAYEKFVTVMARMETVFAGWPDNDKDFNAFVQKKVRENPEFLQKLGPSVEAVEKDMKPIMKAFDDLGKKYDIENLDAVAGPK